MASKDFNYQVALKEGLKSLEQGRLRQAEQSFKYLVDKFPGAEGGYRGLAKVHFEQEDRPAALKVLREGAAALTKSGERSGAIGLLRQAVVLDPPDLATHRRLAAALALAGDTDASVQEYARFIRGLRDSGETDRAKNEAAFAKGQLRGVTGVTELAAIADGTPSVTEEPAKREEPLQETTRFSEREGGTALRPQPVDQRAVPRAEPVQAFTPPEPPAATSSDDPWAAPPPTAYPLPSTSEQQVREITLENDPWATLAPTPAARWTPPEAPAEDGSSEEVAATLPVEAKADDAWSPEPQPGESNGEPTTDVDPEGVEAAAARYLATRDPRAAGMALEAARYYIEEGHLDAASDLLLQLIAAGVADHDAQRLLVDVVRTLGKREVAKTKCELLVHALLLDGRNDLAAEVEALALAD
jgi:thioredoxin-like negative regulator of GroEL